MTLCPHCGQPMPLNDYEFTGSFAGFWVAYPHKVGKGAAKTALRRALAKATIAVILDGLERYKKAKPPSVPYCNPATWLNQERWTDEAAYIDTTQKPEPPKQDGFEIWRVRIRNYLKDGSWPQIAPPLEQCPWQVRAEFEEQLQTAGQIRQARLLP